MMTKTKAFLPHEKMMETWHKGRRVLRTEISFKALKLDHRLQARDKPLDLDQVKELHGYVKDGAQLAPITVFRIDGTDYCGNGFHRSEVYQKEGRPSILADVILDATWQEAVEFATCCNMANSALTPTKEDRKKACFMLLNAGWLYRSAPEIARHVGVSPSSVTKWRVEWCEKSGRPVPETIVTQEGTARSIANRKDGSLPAIQSRGHGRGFSARIGGRRIYLGATPKDAKTELQVLIGCRSASLAVYRSGGDVAQFLARRSIHFDTSVSDARGISGGSCCGFAVTTIPDDLKSSNVNACARAIVLAVGRAVLISEHYNSDRKAVLVHDPIDGHETIVSLARRLGIEFMTLEQFVEVAKADEGETIHPKSDTV